MNMIETVNINRIFKISEPFRNFIMRCRIRKMIMQIMGSKAGKAFKLEARCPLSSSIRAVWVPHPGHSIPKVDFQEHPFW
jgi:hypothetical protein